MATGELIEVDPETALAHALVARRLASRIPAVREAVGLAAYHAGQWQAAIGELRAYHRMTGRQSHLAMLADCERALGRSERAIDLYRAADRGQMSRDEAAELLIVAAGARADLGQRDAALAMLQVPELRADEPWVARLRYAYADALLGVGRREDAREWFARAAEVDEDAATDAAERLLELDGVVLDDGDVSDDLDDGELEDDDAPARSRTSWTTSAWRTYAARRRRARRPRARRPRARRRLETRADDPTDDADRRPRARMSGAMISRGPRREAEKSDDDERTAAVVSLARAYDLIIVDLDGVVYLGDQAVPGAAAAIRTAAEAGSAFAYATNNASRGADEVAALLRSLGVPAEADQVLTSARVAARVLAADLPASGPGAGRGRGRPALRDRVRRADPCRRRR